MRRLLFSLRTIAIVAGLLLGATSARAGQQTDTSGQTGAGGLPPGYDGPPAPVAPEVIRRSEDRTKATIRAFRIATPIEIDGRLDEAMYAATPSISDFIQQEPREGEPATEKTDVWVFFDDENFYLAARCWNSQPERMIATEMRRDGSRIPRNENLAFGLDPYLDHRNGFNFEFTPVGGMMDAQIANDGGALDSSWNSILEHGATRFDEGWSVEVRIPFKTLRYQSGVAQAWGLQVRRMVRWKNEIGYITHLPASIGERGHMRLSMAPLVVGLEVPPPARNIEIKPYVISSVSTDRTVTPRISNDGHADVGGDVKYGITKSLTADFTYNTDFAQVEADLQQVNLTRFSLFFPEKREFFLENSGTFRFASGSGTGGPGGGGGGNDTTPQLFYSRRIGLNGTTAVPILAGGRVSGRVGPYTLGLLDIASDKLTDPGLSGGSVRRTNFAVLRVRRDILRRSYIGAMFTGRSIGQSGSGSNEAFGVDASFSVTTNFQIVSYLAKTRTEGRKGDDLSYKASADYTGDRYGALLEHTLVGPNFNPEIGFVPRQDMRRTYGQFRFSPRPKARSLVRKFYYNGSAEYVTTTDGRVDNKTYTGEFAMDFQSGDRASVKYSDFFEYLPTRLSLGSGIVVPIGTYTYRSVIVGYNFGPQRFWFTTNTSVEHGTYRNGHKTSATITSGAVSWPPHLIVEPSYTLNYVTLPQGTLNQNLVGPRITYGFTPQAFLSALVQYNTAAKTLSSNVRLRWEYKPGSELFVVWNEQHDTLGTGLPLQNRALVVKFNHLWRY